MKNVTSLFALAATLFIFTACNSTTVTDPLKIQDLKKGMTKQQVLDLLGEPLKFEQYHEPNIWFYYTKPSWADSVITRDECTPVVFDELEMVSGWGYKFYKKEVLFK